MKISMILRILVLTLSVVAVKCQQISTPCTSSMVSSFTPCLDFITGSSAGGSGGPSSPTTECCGSLKSLMSGGMECACLIITANVPLPININRALNLPRACNMGGVPIQCKATGSPLPAPGPFPFSPGPPPSASSPFSPQASKAAATEPAPEPDATLAPGDDEPLAPTTNQGIRPVAQPSPPSLGFFASPPLPFVLLIAIFVFKLCCM